jgi:hypothetical protein
MKSGDLSYILNSEIRRCEVISALSLSLFLGGVLINVLTELTFNSLKIGSWLLYIPPGFTFKNSAFCPRGIYRSLNSVVAHPQISIWN